MPTSRPLLAQGSPLGFYLRSWKILGGAFAAGVLLSLLVLLLLWLDRRNDKEFYRADPGAPPASGQVFEPLPAPMSGDREGRSASGLTEATEEIAKAPPRPVEPRPAPPSAQRPPPTVANAPPPPRPTQALAPGSVPQPIERVAPKYPADALRSNQTGTVVVRVEVGADGEPTDVSVARSSRSRSLDRAAMQAVRRWKFRPAQQDGRAVAATVEVPVEFSLAER
jgi:periplasmic protein TonB